VTRTEPTIADLDKANRYLLELAATMPLDEAVERIHSKADAYVRNELDVLRRYVDGDSSSKPARELALYADFLKAAPDAVRAAAGVRTLNESLADARLLAHAARAGLPTEIAYCGLLLAIATLLATLWLLYVAPQFAALFAQLEAPLPPLSQAIVNAAALVYVPIGVLALALAGVAHAAYRQAAAIEALAPLPRGWSAWLVGGRAARAHAGWRLAALASAQLQAGVPVGQAMRVAARESHGAELDSELALAAELGLAAHELTHRRQRSLQDYRAAIELSRVISMRALQLGIALVVGAIVISIYLPIFRMGAVV
jgi:type II secretory pathway component PulF